MSAERLREAAKVLRERAEAATDGPWLTYADGSVDGVSEVGLAVADWLFAVANIADVVGVHSARDSHALTVTDAILGADS